jgi:DNA repair protein RAD16
MTSEEDEDEEAEEAYAIDESSEDEPLSKRIRTTKATPRRYAGRVARDRITKTAPIVEENDEREVINLDTESDFDPEDDEPLADRRGSLDSMESGASAPAANTMNSLAAVNNRRRTTIAEARRHRLADMRSRRIQPGADRKERRRAKLEKAHPEINTMWKELENVPIIKPVEAPQPEAITRRLKPFQLEGLDWMVRQEKSS